MVQGAVEDVALAAEAASRPRLRSAGRAGTVATALEVREARRAVAMPSAAPRLRRALGGTSIVELVAFVGVVLLSADALLALVAERPLEPGHWFIVGLMGLMSLAGLFGATLAVTRALRLRLGRRR